MSQENRLHAAFHSALERYERDRGMAFPASARLTVTPDNAFWALAEPDGAGVHIHVSSGVEDGVSDMWHRAMAYSVKLPDAEQLNVGNVEQAIDVSLMWLMLHELHHFEMGHFKINGGACLVENNKAYDFALTSRSVPKTSLIDGFSMDEQARVRRCLELQADHDATELLLGAYSTDGWDVLRFYAACIFVVMVLIDREDHSPQKLHRTHPKAATRIFQFLGYLSALWTVPALVKAKRNKQNKVQDEDIPSTQEIEAYHAHVIAPAIGDAILMARANEAQTVLNDIGSAEDFVADIRLAQLPDCDDAAPFNSVGAQEYNSLLTLNLVLLDYLDLDQFSS